MSDRELAERVSITELQEGDMIWDEGEFRRVTKIVPTEVEVYADGAEYMSGDDSATVLRAVKESK